MSDKSLIYVAGNPDAYPLEYYDEATGTYQGVIPQLLARFSEESGYDVVYYSPQAKDQREHLAKNLQVDLLSGYTQGDDLPGAAPPCSSSTRYPGTGGTSPTISVPLRQPPPPCWTSCPPILPPFPRRRSAVS